MAISVENRKFSPPVYLTPPLNGLTLKLGIDERAQNN